MPASAVILLSTILCDCFYKQTFNTVKRTRQKYVKYSWQYFYKTGIEPEYEILWGNKIKPKLHGSDLF